jgi:hypothetical protein
VGELRDATCLIVYPQFTDGDGCVEVCESRNIVLGTFPVAHVDQSLLVVPDGTSTLVALTPTLCGQRLPVRPRGRSPPRMPATSPAMLGTNYETPLPSRDTRTAAGFSVA